MKTPVQKPTRKPPQRVAADAPRITAATPGHPLERARPEERAHPSLRKAKHKHPPAEMDEEESQGE